jgi:hypothetical protein
MMNLVKNPIVTGVAGLLVGTGFGYYLRGVLDARSAAKPATEQAAAAKPAAAQ